MYCPRSAPCAKNLPPQRSTPSFPTALMHPKLSSALTIGLRILIYGCLAFVFAAFLLIYWRSRDLELKGPRSNEGLQTFVRVHDRGITWSADFYCDVEIRDPAGNVVARWADTGGQQSGEGVDAFVRSMRWESDSALTFYDDYHHAPVTVSVPFTRIAPIR